MKEDGCGAIVLGCSGMTGLAAPMSQQLGIPVIDGVGVAVKFVEALAGLSFGTSKVGELADPTAKPCLGILSAFTRSE